MKSSKMLDAHNRNISDEPISTDGFDSGKISSMSSDTTASHCTSFSRQSFDLPANSPDTAAEPSPPPPRPHRAKPRLGFRDFRLVRQIGSGDIGRVYLCRLRQPSTAEEAAEGEGRRLYAMKVVDREAVAMKKKTGRAETERKVMRMLNHPFLPTLYAEFEAENFSCVVMEYCAGGDLHSLRHRQPHKRFSLASARFYAAEVLVALEYLHMLGIIYRDLKPENVLVRSDGHVMLTDFDLSLCSDAIPAVEYPAQPGRPGPFSCLPARRLFGPKKVRFVAEPTSARSGSFVGTHEYVAPEVAAGGPHGSAVDWWALGVFLYEMVYGRTPFAGPTNEATLRGISGRAVEFPGGACGLEARARDLISGLLEKDPRRRLGSRGGAGDVKAHPFFKGMNFALIRSAAPPPVSGWARRRREEEDEAVAGGGLLGVF